jgi:hypothetical protein
MEKKKSSSAHSKRSDWRHSLASVQRRPEVRYYIKDQKEADIADGFVAKSENPEKNEEWADIIFFDDTLGQGEKAQALRDRKPAQKKPES